MLHSRWHQQVVDAVSLFAKYYSIDFWGAFSILKYFLKDLPKRGQLLVRDPITRIYSGNYWSLVKETIDVAQYMFYKRLPIPWDVQSMLKYKYMIFKRCMYVKAIIKEYDRIR